MNTLVQFAVYGCPQPQGSTRAFIPKGWTRPVITTDDAKLKPWRQQLSQTALTAMNEAQAAKVACGAAVSIRVAFYFERPKSAKKSARWKITKPDLDKLVRAVLDGLTGIAYEDDAQVCECAVAKLLGSPARVEIQIRALEAVSADVPKTLSNASRQLFDSAPVPGSISGVPKTHDFGTTTQGA